MAADRGAGAGTPAPDSTEPPVPLPAPEPDLPPAFESYATDDLPNATPRGPGKDGLLEATFGRSGDGPTRLLRDRAEVPLHHTGTLDHDPLGPTLCVQEPTGGVAQGDRHRLAVVARAGSRAVVTTQAATKVHSMHSDYAHLDASLRVAPGAHVEYVPGPTIVNADARCLQTLRVALARDASAIVSDVLVTDGLSEHAPFDFDHYHARLDARHGGDLVCADAVDVRPADRDPRDPAGVGDHTVVGSLYVLAPDAAEREGSDESAQSDGTEPAPDAAASLDGTAADLADLLDDRLQAACDGAADAGARGTDTGGEDAHDGDEQLRAGASTLPFDAGVGVRVLGTESRTVEAALHEAREAAREALLGVGVPDPGRCR